MGNLCYQEERTNKNNNKKKTNEKNVEEISEKAGEYNTTKEKKEKKLLNTKSKEETKILLESLFKSYYAAKTYFNKNELKEKEVDAIHCCKKITEAQDLLNSGKHKEIDISKLPKELKSEYITPENSDKEEENEPEIQQDKEIDFKNGMGMVDKKEDDNKSDDLIIFNTEKRKRNKRHIENSNFDSIFNGSTLMLKEMEMGKNIILMVN